MLIHSLALENFKSYARATIEFSPGTNAIIGSNGSGKTTILEAIGFALFNHRPGKLTSFVREGRQMASVAVDFRSDYDERAYQIVRRCGSSNLYQVLDPELASKICDGRADVIQFLREHLGIDPETNPANLFKNAVGVPQGSFTASFLMVPSARKPIFDPLLKVAEYRKAFDKLSGARNLLRQRQGDQAVEISRLQGELTRLPIVQAETKALTSRISNAKTELRDAQKELTAVESAQQTMEAERERLLELQSTVQIYRQTVAEQVRTADAARQRLAESEEAVATTEANRAGHEAYRAAQKAQGAVNERMAQRRRLEEEQTAIQAGLTRAEAQEDSHKRTLTEFAEAKKRAAALADEATKQEELETELRDAQRQADRLHDAVARMRRDQASADRTRERMDRLRAEAAQGLKIEASLTPLQASVEALQQKVTEQEARKSQLEEEREMIKEQGQQIKASESSAKCPVCEQPLSPDQRRQLLDRLRQRWQEVDRKAKAITEEIRQAEEKCRQARATLRQQEQTLRALPRQEAVETAERELTELLTQLTEARAATKRLELAPPRVEQLLETLQALGDPRRRRDAALQQAQGRERVERALQEQLGLAEDQRKALAAIDERMADFVDLDAEAARITSQLEEFQNADDLYRRNQAAAEALPQRRQEVVVAEKEFQEGKERLESGQAQLAASTREFDEEQFQKVVAQVDELRSRSVRLETELGQWRERLDRAKEEIAQLHALEKRLTNAQSRRDQLAEQEELLRLLRSVIQEAGPFITKALVQQISYSANQLFGQIMEDYTRTLRWEEDYGIILEVDGREREFLQLSGGEQMSAALAVRLALLQEMSSIGVAFFDEPTTNLDETRRGALARQIVGVRGFEQLFIISHDDSFEQATEKLVRVEKRSGASEIFYE